MANCAADLPRPALLQRSLRKVTERLARELSGSSQIAPDWTDFEWRIARAAASLHGVSGLLATTLDWQGPSGWRRFIEEQRDHVAERHRRIVDLVEQVDSRAREMGIALVGLKGIALHAQGYYRPGERPMADIDLLTRPRDVGVAGRLLESLGFRESYANWKHQVFAPAHAQDCAEIGEHSRNYLKIELHSRITELLPLRPTDVTSRVFPEQPQPGINGYPSTAALMIHLLVHAAGAMAFRVLRLLHLHDIASVSARMSADDWRELAACDGGPWWALPPLSMVSRYYEIDIPLDVLEAAAARCQWALRRRSTWETLSDVSMSYIWIEAFPGIGWSRTLGEKLAYIRSRIRPSRDLLHLREIAADSQVALDKSDWGRMSQRRRMLRWLTSRPTRPDTVHAVRYALGQAL